MGIFFETNETKASPRPGPFNSAPIWLPLELDSYMARPLLRRVIGDQLTERRLMELSQRMPLHEATLGSQAMSRGQREADSELFRVGEAMIVTAVVKAWESKKVPDEVTQQVVDLAVEHQVDPQANNRVKPAIADSALHIIHELGPQSS